MILSLNHRTLGLALCMRCCKCVEMWVWTRHAVGAYMGASSAWDVISVSSKILQLQYMQLGMNTWWLIVGVSLSGVFVVVGPQRKHNILR